MPLSTAQTYYKIIVTFTICLIKLWITSTVISTIFNMSRLLYSVDYRVIKFLKYLKLNGVSNIMVDTVLTYTKALWQRNKDKWLPELVKEAPTCLRQDIYCSLYIHHLLGSTLYRNLPQYFLRQLVVRMNRIVIFPGKLIVREGDIYPVTYFIHEGEVEKWYTDESGDSKLASVLTMNGYFGLIPGLYPDVPYQFSYHSRTVVDLITLRYDNWQDIIDNYPKLKKELYESAKKIKLHMSKS